MYFCFRICLLFLLAVATASTALSALAEFSAQGTTVATFGDAPDIFHDEEEGNDLEVVAVFDTERAPVELSATSAVYEALYGLGSINGVIVPLYDVTLRVTRREAPFFGSYLLQGVTAEGWVMWVYGYSEDPAVVPSLAFPVDGIVEPAGELYRRWDVGAEGANWWSVTDQIDTPQVEVFNAPSSESGAPVIKKHPESRVVKTGGSAKLQVNAVGKNLSYQWYKDGQPLAEETEAKLERKKASLADMGWYWVVVRNEEGASTSAWVYLQVG